MLASFDKWCLCVKDDTDDEEDDAECGCLGEESAPSDAIRTPLEFPLANYCDVVSVKLAASGMYIKVGESDYFEIPATEQVFVWDVIETRLLGKSI